MGRSKHRNKLLLLSLLLLSCSLASSEIIFEERFEGTMYFAVFLNYFVIKFCSLVNFILQEIVDLKWDYFKYGPDSLFELLISRNEFDLNELRFLPSFCLWLKECSFGHVKNSNFLRKKGSFGQLGVALSFLLTVLMDLDSYNLCFLVCL